MRIQVRPSFSGVIAQLVERLHGMQEVRSSTLLGSTIPPQPEKLRGLLKMLRW